MPEGRPSTGTNDLGGRRTWFFLVRARPGASLVVRCFRRQEVSPTCRVSRGARCGCASANLGARVGADNSRTRGDSRCGRCNREQLFRSWWIHVAFSLEDDVETFWAAPTQLSGPGVSCFTRDRPPAADRQTRMAPISFVLSIWSRLHTPRLVSPSSVDYRDPGNLGRQSGHQPLVDELV